MTRGKRVSSSLSAARLVSQPAVSDAGTLLSCNGYTETIPKNEILFEWPMGPELELEKWLRLNSLPGC
jgi:hypothetical protein